MKILVVDDHPLTREALRGVFADLDSNAALLEAGDSRQAMRLIAEHADLALILLDLNLPDRDGFSVLTELRERHPTIAVVVLSGVQDRNSVMKALDLGAAGFIPKTGQREVLMSALRLVFAGGNSLTFLGKSSRASKRLVPRPRSACSRSQCPRI